MVQQIEDAQRHAGAPLAEAVPDPQIDLPEIVARQMGGITLVALLKPQGLSLREKAGRMVEPPEEIHLMQPRFPILPAWTSALRRQADTPPHDMLETQTRCAGTPHATAGCTDLLRWDSARYSASTR
jgi:hypothetical protein